MTTYALHDHLGRVVRAGLERAEAIGKGKLLADALAAPLKAYAEDGSEVLCIHPGGAVSRLEAMGPGVSIVFREQTVEREKAIGKADDLRHALKLSEPQSPAPHECSAGASGDTAATGAGSPRCAVCVYEENAASWGYRPHSGAPFALMALAEAEKVGVEAMARSLCVAHVTTYNAMRFVLRESR